MRRREKFRRIPTTEDKRELVGFDRSWLDAIEEPC